MSKPPQKPWNQVGAHTINFEREQEIWNFIHN